MKNGSKTLKTFLVFILLFSCGIIAGYIYLTSGIHTGSGDKKPVTEPTGEKFTFLKVYYPYQGRLNMEERRVRHVESKMDVAKATLEEFLKGPAGINGSYVPEGARLLGTYEGSDGVFYIDISDEFRREFQGDALAEFLLLRGIYESMISNVYGIGAVKILIDGQEVESIGGHILLRNPLGDAVSQTMTEEDEGG